MYAPQLSCDISLGMVIARVINKSLSEIMYSSSFSFECSKTSAVLPTTVFQRVECTQLKTGTRRISRMGMAEEALLIEPLPRLRILPLLKLIALGDPDNASRRNKSDRSLLPTRYPRVFNFFSNSPIPSTRCCVYRTISANNSSNETRLTSKDEME